MKRHLILNLFLILSISAFAQEKNFIDQNYIEVTGKSELELIPDKIYVDIVLNEKEFKNKTMPEMESLMVKQLKKAGVDVEKDLKIKDMSSNFTRTFLRKTPMLSKQYSLLLKDGKVLVKVFRYLDEVGISNLSIAQVDHSQMEKYQKEVKVNAVKAAKDKALELSQAIGQTIGRALYIYETNYDLYRPSNRKMLQMAYSVDAGMSEKEDDMDIEFQPIKLAYSILVRFELK